MDLDAQERLYTEYLELLDRKSRLTAFILNPTFEDLPTIDRRDLREQLSHMQSYWHILARRVARHIPGFDAEQTS